MAAEDMIDSNHAWDPAEAIMASRRNRRGACGVIYFWEGKVGRGGVCLRCFSRSWWRNHHWSWVNWIINRRAASGCRSALQDKRNLIASHYCPLNIICSIPRGSQGNLTQPGPARTREGIAVSTASVERPGPRGGSSSALIDAYGNVCWCNFSPKGSVEEAKTCRGARSLTSNSGL